MKKLLLALSLTMAMPCVFAQLGPTWAKDDFSNADQFTGALGSVYWYVAPFIPEPNDEDAEPGSASLERTANGLNISFTQPAGRYGGFGVTFDGATIDLSNDATLELEIAYIEGNIDNLLVRVQLKDINDNSAEIMVPAGTITWSNRKEQVGFEIPEGQSVSFTKSLSGLQVVDVASTDDGWFCNEADGGGPATCPATLDIFDMSKVKEMYFTPLDPSNGLFSGEFVVKSFSIGAVGTTPAKPEIEYTTSGADLIFRWTETSGATYVFEKGDGNGDWVTVANNLTANNYAIALADLSDGDQFRVFVILDGASSEAAYTTVEEVPEPTPGLSAPTGLSASLVTESSATLSWNAVTGATGYRIEKFDGSDSWSEVQIVDGTTYSLTELTAKTQYLYRVFAINSDEESEPTEVEFTTLNPVGIFKSLSSKQLSIFPNPTSGQVNVVFENAGTANVQIKVATMMGTEVASFNASNERASFDVAGFTKGMYMIHVIANGETIAIDKLIVK